MTNEEYLLLKIGSVIKFEDNDDGEPRDIAVIINKDQSSHLLKWGDGQMLWYYPNDLIDKKYFKLGIV